MKDKFKIFLASLVSILAVTSVFAIGLICGYLIASA